ncbi:MAG: type II toxin-antitoxin system RelE/ParE family toxin [Candidatus Woesebacteria bacterium]|nr:type II toxin-antitoxin system RelE/ParE family toxin [Candidatus Woesebacteria bacterium]
MKVIYHPTVEATIRRLPEKQSSKLFKVIELFIDYNFVLTSNFLKKISGQVWELRSGRYRLLFGVISNNMIAVCVFLKKTQKTPNKEIKLAQRRLKEYE